MTRSYSPPLDLGEAVLELAVRPHVGGKDHRPRLGKAHRRLFGDALDPRTDRDQRILDAAGRAHFRPLLLMPAMMAHQHAAKTVLDQPGRAIGALILVPAGPAQRQRRIAPPIEEQQRLLAAVERREHFARQPRRDPRALFRRLLAHVERGDVRQPGLGEARGQQHMLVAARIGVVARFDRRRRRAQDHPGVGEFRPHHRHVAGVVVDPVILLEGAVMLLVEHNQPQLVERQEQRRARPEHRADGAVIDAAPGAAALARRHVRMPLGRPRAEAPGEALDEGVGERDLRQNDQRLPPGPQRVRHRLEEHFGLAAAGDPVEQAPRRISPHRARGSAPALPAARR